MAQFDVYRNANRATKERVPFLLDVQAELLRSLATRIVVPLCTADLLGGKRAEGLNPEFEIEGRKVMMLTPELAGIPRRLLGERVASLATERSAIIAALDVAFTGI